MSPTRDERRAAVLAGEREKARAPFNALRRAAESGEEAHNAPGWVHAVTPAEIVRQRSLKWPDFHPEDFCHQCGRRNPCWFADTEVWQTATGSTGDGGGVYCPTCFAELWETKTGKTAILWRLSIDSRSRDFPDGGEGVNVGAPIRCAECRPLTEETS